MFDFAIGSLRNLLIIETVAAIKVLTCGVVNSPIYSPCPPGIIASREFEIKPCILPACSAVVTSLIGIIIKTGLAFALANVAYDFARGACDGLGSSANTKLFMSWIAAAAMIACFYYWAGRVRKMV